MGSLRGVAHRVHDDHGVKRNEGKCHKHNLPSEDQQSVASRHESFRLRVSFEVIGIVP